MLIDLPKNQRSRLTERRTGAASSLAETDANLALLSLVSEKLQAQAQLKFQGDFLQHILDAIPAPIFYKDVQGVYLGCNTAFERYLGRSRDEILGRTAFDIAPAELARIYHQADQNLMDAGGVQVYETRVLGADGQAREVMFHKSVFSSAEGQPGGLVGVMLDISERKEAEKRLRRLAQYDPLTDLPNRVLLEERLAEALGGKNRQGDQGALLVLDLDRFKEINDSFGRAAGDEILVEMGKRLTGSALEGDTVARLSSDEFAVLLLDGRGKRDMTLEAKKILALMNTPHFLEDGQEVQIGASLGITFFPEDARDGKTLLCNADLAVHEAKLLGRNTLQRFTPAMSETLSRKREVLAQLRRALQEQQFFLQYQPQFDAATGRLVGAEALLRWRLPDGSLVSPQVFIPVAEEAGLIGPLGDWVLRAACLQAKAWRDAGFPPLRLAVNISGHQFVRPGFIETVDLILAETGVDPTHLEMEVTESTLMRSVSSTIEVLTDLRVRGIHLAIDDFGTGYSSLSYLKNFPIDRIKIDRSFTRDMTTNPDDAVIVQTIIAMGKNLGLEVIAEGVENAEQRDFLLRHDCRYMQGYFFGKPLAAEEFARLGAAAEALPS
ncbi:putative bifunctional diguanylate cyclase/phosphodiesterase [Geoalkalibacter sp.]|uniref:putative bifunctional diguanylate cyclase/phosphodiesterase n=1 Tax=Geoalkalibacter sp. TaxID=3041440 RepID=UPI00272DDB3D|nr:EAL domain-containing protein [Geoalkalibacter sp.]